MSGLYLVENENGPAYDRTRGRREQDGWREHAAFMDGLVEQGFIVLGGPIGEGEGESTLLLVRCDDEQTARGRRAADPWQGTLLRIATIRPWQLWLGSVPAG